MTEPDRPVQGENGYVVLERLRVVIFVRFDVCYGVNRVLCLSFLIEIVFTQLDLDLLLGEPEMALVLMGIAMVDIAHSYQVLSDPLEFVKSRKRWRMKTNKVHTTFWTKGSTSSFAIKKAGLTLPTN